MGFSYGFADGFICCLMVWTQTMNLIRVFLNQKGTRYLSVGMKTATMWFCHS